MMLEWLMELSVDKEMKVEINQELKAWLLLLLYLGDVTNNPAQHFMSFIKGDKEMKVKVNHEMKDWLLLLHNLGDVTNNPAQHFMSFSKGKKRVIVAHASQSSVVGGNSHFSNG